jgi:hypothetical protein
MIGRILLADLAALTLLAVVVLGRYLLEERSARKRARAHLTEDRLWARQEDRLVAMRAQWDWACFIADSASPLDADQEQLAREWLTFLAERGPTKEHIS